MPSKTIQKSLDNQDLFNRSELEAAVFMVLVGKDHFEINSLSIKYF